MKSEMHSYSTGQNSTVKFISKNRTRKFECERAEIKSRIKGGKINAAKPAEFEIYLTIRALVNDDYDSRFIKSIRDEAIRRVEIKDVKYKYKFDKVRLNKRHSRYGTVFEVTGEVVKVKDIWGMVTQR